ncbi:hypothetical protein AVEN_256930-1 [Araneus ventricosus]|uniref:Uncharacterized protein n=1 Tax=Araneus ventricosus TaxID=182803 RepID=A0A4Y2CG52_ARAVE|nr:hypothetical protein AVEN_256930-1 [Araneus ventricosus]
MPAALKRLLNQEEKYKVSDIYSALSGESTEVFDDEEHKESKEMSEECVKAGAYMLVKFQGDGKETKSKESKQKRSKKKIYSSESGDTSTSSVDFSNNPGPSAYVLVNVFGDN